MNTANLYDLLDNGYFPTDLAERNRYDAILNDNVLAILPLWPQFHLWLNRKMITDTPVIREGAEVPVITTAYNISKWEVPTLRADRLHLAKFMEHMGTALANKALPCEEVFALLVDAFMSKQWCYGNNLENVH